MLGQKNRMFIGVLIAVSCLVGTANAAIEINGLNGAQHWVWMEAEYASSLGAATLYDNWGRVSGYSNASASNSNVGSVRLQTGDPTTTLAFSALSVPANMSNAMVYIRNNGQYERTNTVNIDGQDVGSSLSIVNSWTDSNIFYWSAPVSAGALTQGDHAFQIVTATAPWSILGIDGFFITDGAIALSNASVDDACQYVTEVGERFYMQAPSAVSSPLIEGAVTPTFSVSGYETVEYYLNGETYTPGTPIGEGSYQLQVVAYDSSGNRYVAGANFDATPEPTTMVVLALGSLSVLLRKKRSL